MDLHDFLLDPFPLEASRAPVAGQVVAEAARVVKNCRGIFMGQSQEVLAPL